MDEREAAAKLRTYPARITQSWLRGLDDAQLLEAVDLLWEASGNGKNEAAVRAASDRWHRAYDIALERGLIKEKPPQFAPGEYVDTLTPPQFLPNK